MSQSVFEVGRGPYKGTTAENTAAVTPIAINTAKTITLPAIPVATSGGPLECLVVIEGTNNSRFTTNGVTPTSSVGQLLVPSNGLVSLVLRGQKVISAFKVIDAGTGSNTFTYEFYTSEIR